jgi:hypothetical protein
MPTEVASGLEFDGNPLQTLLVLLAILGGTAFILTALLSRQLPVSSPPSRRRAAPPPLPATAAPSAASINEPPAPRPPIKVRATGSLGNRRIPEGGVSGKRPIHGLDRAPSQGGKERRTTLRRRGKPVPILVAGGDAAGEARQRAWVIDRSRGGVCIVSPTVFAVGQILRIQRTDAPDPATWVEVEVRSCRAKGKKQVLGCRFVKDLPWSVLLMFG